MIVMCIAIRGDNTELAQRDLAALCENFRTESINGSAIYRAWVERSSSEQVDARLDPVAREVSL